MQVNPHQKSLTYPMDNIGSVETSVNEIEKEVLENESVNGDVARNICSELEFIRQSLCLKPGIRRHKKWAPELQDNSDT